MMWREGRAEKAQTTLMSQREGWSGKPPTPNPAVPLKRFKELSGMSMQPRVSEDGWWKDTGLVRRGEGRQYPWEQEPKCRGVGWGGDSS